MLLEEVLDLVGLFNSDKSVLVFNKARKEEAAFVAIAEEFKLALEELPGELLANWVVCDRSNDEGRVLGHKSTNDGSI